MVLYSLFQISCITSIETAIFLTLNNVNVIHTPTITQMPYFAKAT